ncbi:DUF5686 and carboxypeptidase regulatory-like domain-containing protein [Flammeovirgaceae bacterium SG7u.111]|nr:DUF5686 and carboxypeptidase regulatory-like domain-containing protein [Flammeovirgaceae bacterium SG7u.132]WPO35817.1 DUF5686 and carboxypeptidase regulatory-like domain-containing protein [Flammeovirgaceae bacterium SG7u.111]
MKFNLLLITFLLIGSQAFSQGIRGHIYDHEKQPLPYASLYIKQLETGTATNMDGFYEIKLKPGSYDLVFQYLGRETVSKKVAVGNDFLELDIVMPLQVYQLREVEVTAKREDPAYTIMRKAIAKSKYHLLQVDKYTANVYIKGGGRLKDSPFFLRKKLEKEGIDSSTVFLTESVTEVTFEQPNKLTENVISIRTVGENESAGPNQFIYGSFYEPMIAENFVSPLSPKAFVYYKFKLMGSYQDRGREVNKIRVIPRSRGDNVFTGYIYIMEDLWSIHSLDLYTYIKGFKIRMKQINAPIQEAVWMPVTYRFEVDGSIYGFDMEYKYLATVSDYKIELNPDLAVEMVVVDEKVEKKLAEVLAQEEKLDLPDENVEEVFKEKKKYTRKELKKVFKEYEKELEEQKEEPEVVVNTNMTIDSMAYKNDSLYWANIRPVPLNNMERNSYKKLDSLAVVQTEEEETGEESPKKKQRSHKGFHTEDVLFGNNYKLGDSSRLEYTSPLLSLNFNTVEGFNFNVPLTYKLKLNRHERLEIGATGRYAFSREQFSGKLMAAYKFNSKTKINEIQVEGGRFVSQFNGARAINPLINSFATLFWEQNHMKIYEKDYGKLNWLFQPQNEIKVNTNVEWGHRRELVNNTDLTWIKKDDKSYSPNAPQNIELDTTGFPTHQALTFDISIDYQPFLKYKIRNNKKTVIPYSSPIFNLSYRKGFKNIADSDVDFDALELGFKHRVNFGVKGRLDMNFYAGTFLNTNQLYFMDYKHFPGNLTVLQESDPVGSFRLLDYYNYSTAKNYMAGHLYYQFRKLLLTQIFEVRMLGWRENFLVNYLKTESSPHYTEVGYSIDNIFRFLRVEVVGNFYGSEFKGIGARIGISTDLDDLISF